MLEQVNIHLLDALFDKLAGDFSTVSVLAEDWRRTGLAVGILADNYREMAAAVPTVWRGDTADAMTAKMEEFAENLDAAAECVEMVQMAIDDMLTATKSAMEFLAMSLSLIDDLCMYFAGSLAKVAKEIFTGGRRIKQIIELARDVIRTLEALADLIPALTKTASTVAATLKGLDFLIVGLQHKDQLRRRREGGRRELPPANPPRGRRPVMARDEALRARMAQLRSQVGTFREETAAFREQTERAKTELRPRAEKARADRAEAMVELRRDFADRRVPEEDRALISRVLGGETTWYDVLSGIDEHPTAVDYRARLGAEFSHGVEQLAADDEDLAQALSDAQPDDRGEDPRR